MDQRFGDQTTQLYELIDRALAQLNTSCPGVVQSFDPATATVTVKPAIQLKVTAADGTVSFVDMPNIIKAPVVVPFAPVQGFALTLPISAGDPCLIHFSQRCIDNWLQQGGVQPPETNVPGARHHALNDAIVTMAPSPLTQVLTNWLTTGIELRNRDRSVRITLTDSGVEVNGPVSFLSDVTFHGAMTDKNGVDHTTHKHSGVQTGSGTSGVPTP